MIRILQAVRIYPRYEMMMIEAVNTHTMVYVEPHSESQKWLLIRMNQNRVMHNVVSLWVIGFLMYIPTPPPRLCLRGTL